MQVQSRTISNKLPYLSPKILIYCKDISQIGTHDLVVVSSIPGFFPANLRLSSLLKHVRGVVGGFGKKVVLVLV